MISWTASRSQPIRWCCRPARFVDDAPYASDYTYERIYYRSLREHAVRLPHGARLSLALGYRLVLVLEEPGRAESVAAPTVGRERLNSIFYQKVMRWNTRWKLGAALSAFAA